MGSAGYSAMGRRGGEKRAEQRRAKEGGQKAAK
jgi:hypothetical protein